MMNEKLEKLKDFLQGKKGAYVLLCVGLLGILLIAFSGTGDKEKASKTDKVKMTNEQYCEMVEQKVKEIVTAVTKDKRPNVTVTLDTGIKYIYADETKTDTENNKDVTGDNTKTQSNDKQENKHVIIEDSNGAQQALVVTEYMPTIRGVTIVCDGGNLQSVSVQIKNAVMTALDITSKRVFVTGK